MRPSDLRHAGSNYRDINGTPLLKCSRTLDVYISEKYSIEDTPILEQLGVSSLLPMEFAAHLRHFVHEETEAFQKMSGTWHTQVAAALLIAMTTDPYLADVLGTLPIIPLRTGQWVSSTSQQLYFPRSDQDPSPPPGTLVGEIDPSAVADASRRLLFEELGAEAYSTHLVCAAIVKEQTSPGFDTSTLKLGDYLNRTKFLFFCAWKNHLKTDLWVVTEENTVKRASDTYMQSSKPNSAQTILKNCSTPFNFLHREYHRAPATESSEWNRWLRDNLLVAEYPRLVITWPKVTLAQDLRVLRKEDPIKLLLLLRDRWEGYCGYFTVSESSNLLSDDDKTNLRNTVAAIKVPCTGGQYRPLSQTTLPDSNIIASTIDAIDFMHIPEPEDPRWHFLRTFGVVTNVGTDQFIQYLRQMRCTTVSLKRVTQVYQQLHALVGDNVAEIR